MRHAVISCRLAYDSRSNSAQGKMRSLTNLNKAVQLLSKTRFRSFRPTPPSAQPGPSLRSASLAIACTRRDERHQSHKSYPAIPRLVLYPILFSSSPLLLESTDPANDEDELEEEGFLIPDGKGAPEDEPPPNFFWRVMYFLQRYVIEPLSTTRRFIFLAALFLPVILTSPVLMLEALDGSRDKRRGRAKRESERRTTQWWYRFLVAQMERAGPTFIKVSTHRRVFASRDA